MFKPKRFTNSIEVLESRIAPASVGGTGAGAGTGTTTSSSAPFLPTNPAAYVPANFGAPIEVHAGQVLTTGGFESGTYLAYVQQGEAFFYFTDLNNNKQVDYNELTGIAAGDNLGLVLFTDVHGDIATNLVEQTVNFVGSGGVLTSKNVLFLSDSANSQSNGDGRVLLNKSISFVELRQLQTSDFPAVDGSGVTADTEAALRQGPTTFSIYGNIYAGKSFGTAAGGGLIIDTTGVDQDFGFGNTVVPQVGGIYTGTAASNQFFSYGVSRGITTAGTFLPFTPPAGQGGGDIMNVHAADTTAGSTMKFNIGGLFAGNGGVGANGGSIINVTINGEDTGGYQLVAGNGGSGATGGVGGSILNFSDLGSRTSQVVIQSGSGGIGTSGSGGGAGNFSFGAVNILGDVNIQLGNGGSGFSAGGNGASLLKGTFTQPSILDPSVDSLVGNAYGSSHINSSNPANAVNSPFTATIGTHQSVDFNGDGIGDFVYTTVNSQNGGTSQLVALIGTGDPLDPFTRITLNGVRDATALTVADVNGDGHPDIIVGSSDDGAQEGIVVFLSQFDQHGHFTGFSAGRTSPLPQLVSGDPDVASNQFYDGSSYFLSPAQISSIVAGDFTGSGHTQLAVVATYYNREFIDATTGKINSLANPSQVLLFMEPAVSVDKTAPIDPLNPKSQQVFTGQFFADFGTQKVAGSGGTTVDPQPLVPFVELGLAAANSFKVEATALSTSATHDSVIVGKFGSTDAIQTYDYFNRTPGVSTPVTIGNFGPGKVDVDRLLNTPQQNHTNLQDFPLTDFTVVDADHDGKADVAAITTGPGQFLAVSIGNGNGSGDTTNGSGTGDNAGFLLGTTFVVKAIKSTDTVNGAVNQVAIMQDGIARSIVAYSMTFPGGGAGTFAAAGAPVGDLGTGITTAFDLYYQDATNTAQPDFGMKTAPTSPIFPRDILFSSSPIPVAAHLIDFELHAGNGGDSLIGSGGAGGSIGSGAAIGNVTVNGVTFKSYVGSVDLQLGGAIDLFAGAGGNGFSAGGHGGNVSGVSVIPPAAAVGSTDKFLIPAVSVTAGAGGRGVSGTGGGGGGINQMNTQGGYFFMAGNGGVGLVGGSGGSVVGNGTTFPDTITADLEIFAGNGGDGTKGGGIGGSIVGFAAQLTNTDPIPGDLSYIAGNGGNAVLGTGGAGGSVLNDSPVVNGALQGTLLLQGGAGGNGKTGGAGGSVGNFHFTTSGSNGSPLNPALISVLAGSGGVGTFGSGGKGGGVSGINIDSRGNGGAMNKMVAGDGGGSTGGRGGAGGSVSGVMSSTNGSYALAGGAGGEGLIAGGLGGSVLNSQIGLGASTISKALIIAGAGGSATAFIPSSADTAPDQAQLAFGGTVGRGGNGGSINGFKQIGNVGAHMDLIAGNGGDTINFGTPNNQIRFVGNGGSILNINVVGSIGQVQDATVPIKSYNDFANGQTIQDFVDTAIRNGTVLDDSIGNVGAVVGASGRVKAAPDAVASGNFSLQPAFQGVNGNLIGVSAHALMSAVAGSVDEIAAISVAQNIQIGGPHFDGQPLIGATKHDTTADPNQEYLNASGGIITAPIIGGALLDGAVVTNKFLDGAGNPAPRTGFIYLLD